MGIKSGEGKEFGKISLEFISDYFASSYKENFFNVWTQILCLEQSQVYRKIARA